jgi:ubiquinone/menaquinone biosynthesis C-methylase UbiE
MEGFLKPDEILGRLGLQKTMTAADFGCGSGGWSIPLAKILNEGRVYSIDVLEGPLFVLNNSAKVAGIFNIQTMNSNVESGTKLIPGSCDLVLMTNLLFQCEYKKAVLNEGKRVLKPGGKILVVDWKKSQNFGPRERSVSLEEVKIIATGLGMKVENEFVASPYHWGLVLAKVS